MQTDIKTWLETTGLKVAEERFLKPPPLPYIVFTDNDDVSGSDDKNFINDRNISIELYSLNVDKISEKLIKDLLNAKGISYKNDRVWIDIQMLFSSIYDFNFVEKL